MDARQFRAQGVSVAGCYVNGASTKLTTQTLIEIVLK